MFTTKNLILACHITGIHDVNRNNTLADNDISLISAWAESIKQLGLFGIVFHNSLSSTTLSNFNNKNIHFIEIPKPRNFKPNVYRYFIYRDFIIKNLYKIDNLFITDVTDVSVALNPFVQPFFTENNDTIFCGDEPEILDNEWMFNHSTHFRDKITGYAQFEEKFKQEVLLNCGVIGGGKSIMLELINELCEIHALYNKANSTEFTGDMGAFNFIMRTKFNKQLKHGEPINTIFKSYEVERNDCWFRHK